MIGVLSTNMAIVSLNDVQQVAFLARLQLPDAELNRLAAQLDEILKYVHQLQAVSTEGVEPTSHVLPLSNITRPDQLMPSTPPEDVLTLAPARHGQFFKVPKIID